jgi:hypothetical protein
MPEYFDRYIALAEDTTLLQALSTSLDELKKLPIEKLHALGNQLYAPNKWTIKDSGCLCCLVIQCLKFQMSVTIQFRVIQNQN